MNCSKNTESVCCLLSPNEGQRGTVNAIELSPYLTSDEEIHGRRLILHLTGKADFMAVPKMRALLRQLLTRPLDLVIIDLSKVTVLNTPFWAAFRRYNLDAASTSRLVLAGMNPGLRAAFDILVLGALGDDTGIEVYETSKQALDGVRN